MRPDGRVQAADIARIKLIEDHNANSSGEQHIFETTWDERRALRKFDDSNFKLYVQEALRVFCIKCQKGFVLKKLRTILKSECTQAGNAVVLPLCDISNIIDVRPSESPSNDIRLKHGLGFHKLVETTDHNRIALLRVHNHLAMTQPLHIFPTSWNEDSASKPFDAADPGPWFQSSLKLKCTLCEFKTSFKALKNAFMLKCSAARAFPELEL